MVETVTINSITGTSDYDIWVSNGCAESEVKVYISTISDSDIPYTFNLPIAYQNSAFCVKIYDDNDCIICDCFGIAPSPSPSITPTVTPTPSITPSTTPTPTPTPTCLVPTYLYGLFSGNGFTSGATYTLSPTLHSGRNQWISSSNGTVRWNGYRWEVAGWYLGGVTYYNLNTTTINAPDENSWSYTNCGRGFTCSVSFTSDGCGLPSPTPSITPTISVTPSVTPTISVTPTPSISPTNTVTPTPSITPSSSLTPTPTTTPTNTPTISVTPSPTPSITPTISVTPSVTPTISVTPSITPTISVTPSITPTISVTPSITPSVTPTISVTPSITPTISVTPSVTPTISVTPSITPTISVTPSITPTSSPICQPPGGLMFTLDLIEFGGGTIKGFLSEVGTENGQTVYATSVSITSGSSESEIWIKVGWNSDTSLWEFSQIFSEDGDVQQVVIATSPDLYNDDWTMIEEFPPIETSQGEEFSCDWRYCINISGGTVSFNPGYLPLWSGIPLTEPPNAYTAIVEDTNPIVWSTGDTSWFYLGSGGIELSGGTIDTLPIDSFDIGSGYTLTISSGVCEVSTLPIIPTPTPTPTISVTPTPSPTLPIPFVFRIDTRSGDTLNSYTVPTESGLTYNYDVSW